MQFLSHIHIETIRRVRKNTNGCIQRVPTPKKRKNKTDTIKRIQNTSLSLTHQPAIKIHNKKSRPTTLPANLKKQNATSRHLKTYNHSLHPPNSILRIQDSLPSLFHHQGFLYSALNGTIFALPLLAPASPPNFLSRADARGSDLSYSHMWPTGCAFLGRLLL